MIGTSLGAFAARVFAANVGAVAFLLVLVFVYTVGTQAIAQTMTAPDITSEGPFLVDEGETAVATLTADDSDTATTDLIWSKTGGADSGKFTLTSAVVLTFIAAKDYEAPDDADADGTYEVTVQVSDGSETDSADLVVTLENVVELTALTGPATVAYEENRAVRVATYSASSEADQDGLTWSLSGADADSFRIDEPAGVLRFDLAVVSPNLFSPPPDYDAPADADSDGAYEVTVEVGDGVTSHALAVEVTITDQDEAGTLTLSTTRPQFGVALTTTLTDPDDVTGTVTYQWERSVGRGAWTGIVAATASSYTLTSAETGHFLRVTATYTDGHGGGKTAAARTSEVVTADLLSGLTVSTTDSAANSGHALRPSFDAGILHYSIGCAAADETMTLTPTAGSGVRLSIDGTQVSSAESRTVDVDADSEVRVTLAGASGAATTYFVRCLSGDLLDMTVTTASGATGVIEDLIMFGVRKFGEQSLAIVDANGAARFHLKNEWQAGYFRAAWVASEGGYRYSYNKKGGGRHWQILDQNLEEIANVGTVAPLTSTNNHDARILENGNYVLFSDEPADRDLSGLTFGSFSTPERMRDAAIQVRTPAGESLFVWNSYDAVPLEDCKPGFPPSQPDYAHLNTVQMVDGDIQVASLRGCSTVLRIDPDLPGNHKVVCRLGLTNLSDEQWEGLGKGPPPLEIIGDAEGQFCAQHGSSLLPNGHLILYDNGLKCMEDPWLDTDLLPRPGGEYSRAVEYALDVDNGEAVFLRDHSLGGTRSKLGSVHGHVEALDNGDWLIGWGGGGGTRKPTESVTQVDPNTGEEKFSITVLNTVGSPDSLRPIPLPPVALADDPVPLRAEFLDSGTSSFHAQGGPRPTVVIAFNQPVADFENDTPSLGVQGATVDSVDPYFVTGESAHAYRITLIPDSAASVSINLLAGQNCAGGGICTADGAALTETPAARTIYPAVTVSFGQTTYAAPEAGSIQIALTLSSDPERTVEIPLTFTEQGGASSADYSVISDKVTFNSGETSQSFTFTATHDTVDDDEWVELGFLSLPTGVTLGSTTEATVSITDDDVPAVTVSFEQAIYTAPEGGNVAVKVKLSADPERDVTLTITRTGEGGASSSDYSGVPNTTTIAVGDMEASFTFSATQDADDDDGESVKLGFVSLPTGVTASGTTEATVSITDDDVSPVITTNTASTILVEENETAVATLAATDADRPAEDLTWRITGGADRNGFRLTADGVLTFAAPQDYEAPDDSDGNGDYEVTVEVSDGTNPVEAVFTIRLEDVDDTAPALSSAVVNGATLTLNYGEALDGTSTPAVGDFTVAGGNSARTVSNVAVSGQAVTLTLNPAVEHGETGIRVSYGPGANPTQDAAGNDALGLSNQPVTNNTGDTAAPTVSAIAITSRPDRNATYSAGKDIEVTVTFSETVVVTGTPRLSLNVGGVSRTAAYRSGAGAAAVFVYMVADGESDDVGVSVEANSLTLNGGRIRDGANNNALLTHDGLAANAGHKVDGIKPALAANGGAVVNGATLRLTYDEALDGSSTPLARAFTVNVDGAEPRISRVAVSGSAVTLTLDPEVGVGQTARLTYRVPGANPIQDTVGNAARVITNRTVENNTRDTMAPSVSRVAITSNPGPDGIYAEEDIIEVTVTFSETVTVDTTNGTPSLALTVGRPSQPTLYSPGSASVAQRFTYTVGDNDIDTDGMSIGAGRIALNGGTIQDLADNPSLLVYEAVPPQPGHAVDGVRPVLQGTTVRGTTLTLTYGEALDGDSTPAADDFTVTVADIERLLTQVLVGGSTVTLTLVSEVTPGEAVTVSYTAGTRPIQDAAGNAAEDLTEYTVGTPPPPPPPPPPPITGGGGGGGLGRPPSYPGTIRAEGGEGEWISTGSSDRTHTIAGLVNGRTYFFHLRAVSADGAGSHRISPEATPVADLDFTHFANGGFITSTLVLVNAGAYPVRPAIYFYDQDGDPIEARRVVELTPDLEVGDDGALSPRAVMNPLGELTIATHGRGGLRVGSVTVRAPGSIGGVLRFDIPGFGVAGVADSPTVRDALLPVRRQAMGINTGVAVRNRGTATLTLQCRLMRDGAVLEETIIPLAANGQDSRFIDQVFPVTDTSDFAGSVRCAAPEPGRFSAVAFELDEVHRIFTTLPVVSVPAVPEQEQEQAEEQEQEQQQDATRLDFTHFANGGNIVSSLVLVNAGADPVRPAIYFHDQDGGPVAAESMVDVPADMEIDDDGALRPGTAMNPLGELTISTHGRGGLKVGSVAVVAAGPIGGVLRFDIPRLGVAGVGDSPPVRDALVPVRRQDGGINTGVAVHNRGTTALLVRCRLMRDGAVLEETMIPLAANGQDSRFIDQVFPTADTSDFSGSVRCMTPEPGRFSAVAFELDGVHRIFTTLPVVPVVEVP